MNIREENNNYLVERVALIILFLFIIFAFKSIENSTKDSFYQNAPFTHVINVEKPANIDKSAIIVSQISLENFYISVVSSEIFTYNFYYRNNLLVIFSNNVTKQLLNNCKERFLEIKPQFAYIDLFHSRTSLNSEEISLVS
jgi:type IV secretory pathway TrbL component